jgi:hypothetical protein
MVVSHQFVDFFKRTIRPVRPLGNGANITHNTGGLELGFVYFLGSAIDLAGHQTFPAQ